MREILIIPDYRDLGSSIALADEYGAHFEYNDFFSPSVYSDADEVGRRIEKYSSLDRRRDRDTLHGAFLDVSIASQDKTVRDYSRSLTAQSVEIAERLGVRGVVFHTGLISRLNTGAYREAWLNSAEEVFRPLCEKHPTVEIYMENTFEEDPDVFLSLMERMAGVGNFALCLDYGHAILTKTEPERWVRAFAPHIGHIHLNDNDLHSDLHAPLGDGRIDMNEFVKLNERYKVECPILLEMNGIDRQKRSLEIIKDLFKEKEDNL